MPGRVGHAQPHPAPKGCTQKHSGSKHLVPQVLKRVEAGDTALQPHDKAEVERVCRVSALLETRLIALDPLIALFHQN